MRVCLCHCSHLSGNALSHPKVEHLGMAYLAASLRREGHKVRIVDAHLFDWEVSDTTAAILESSPHLVAFSVLHTNLLLTAAVMVALRRQGFAGSFVLGGYYPTFHAEDILRALPERALIARGEADLSFPQLVACLDGGAHLPDGVQGLSFLDPQSGEYIETGTPEPITNLDELPFPARDTLGDIFRLRNPVISVSPSRGCPYTCTFCSIIAFYRRSKVNPVRERSPERVLDEIEEALALTVTQDANADFVWFCADEFVGEGSDGETFADRLAEAILCRGLIFRWEIACRVDHVNRERFRLLHAAGLRAVYLGVESFSQDTLDNFHKRTTVEQNLEAIAVLDELGIAYTFGTIVFGDKTRFEEIEETHKQIHKIGYRHVTMPLARLKRFSSRKSSVLQPRWRKFDDLLDDSTFLDLYRIAYRIYEYDIEDPQVASLSALLSGIRQRSEENVKQIISLLDSGLLEPGAFWKLVFYLRDGLGAFIERAISAIKSGDTRGARESIIREIDEARRGLADLAIALRNRTPLFEFDLYERRIVWKGGVSGRFHLPGTEHTLAELDYKAGWLADNQRNLVL